MLSLHVECYVGPVNEDRSYQIQSLVYLSGGHILSKDASGEQQGTSRIENQQVISL